MNPSRSAHALIDQMKETLTGDQLMEGLEELILAADEELAAFKNRVVFVARYEDYEEIGG